MAGLGRLYSLDARDEGYQLRQALVLPPVLRTWRHWTPGKPILNQGEFPHCVAYAWKQWLTASPIRQGHQVDTVEVYNQAQLIDEWPGEDYDGTSVRAGAKILQQRGFISNYLWAASMEEIKQWILTKGPVVIGSNWYSSMSQPLWSDYDGLEGYWIKPEGNLDGGHAWTIVGFSLNRHAFRMLNSWGDSWGQHGKAWIAEEHVAQLLLEQGEACTSEEIKVI